MNSAWLAEFHRQWEHARGQRTSPAVMAFSRDWQKLLADAQVTAADDIRHSEREAESLASAGRLELCRVPRRRHLIERIALPVVQEAWLRDLFQSEDPAALQQHSLAEVRAALALGHALYPDLWQQWCAGLTEAFAAGRSARAFRWRQPETVRGLLHLVRELTVREWPPYTLVRDADVALGLPTKTIEGHRRAVESALTQMFRRETPLEALNIITSNSRLLFDGPLTLHFADGTTDESGGLRHGDFVTAADLDRAVRITTTASRILSVENSKTTFRQLAVLNTARDTLIIATSFPTQSARLLLSKLPPALPHWHFGDTDPAGYFILLKLRQLTARPVRAWQMNWRDAPDSPPLTAYDQSTLSTLLAAGEMEDCQTSLHEMLIAGRKGAFEQESLTACLPV